MRAASIILSSGAAPGGPIPPCIVQPQGLNACVVLSSTPLPPQGLSPEEQKHFDALHAELLALVRSEPACPGDGNLDKRVNTEDLRYWQVFADVCAENQNQCSSVYDLNYDAVTDSADRVIIEANFGRRCGVRGFLR
jgi:hypothetical protein